LQVPQQKKRARTLADLADSEDSDEYAASRPGAAAAGSKARPSSNTLPAPPPGPSTFIHAHPSNVATAAAAAAPPPSNTSLAPPAGPVSSALPHYAAASHPAHAHRSVTASSTAGAPPSAYLPPAPATKKKRGLAALLDSDSD